jgi:hypothetical protein
MNEVDTSTAAVRRRKPWLLVAMIAAVAVAAAVTAGVALWPKSGLEKLAARDEHGAAACDMLATWLRGGLHSMVTGDVDDKANVSVDVSELAAAAATPAIRDAVGAPTIDEKTLASLRTGQYFARNPRFTDLRKLHAGCAGAGVDMPIYTDRPKQGQ